MKRAVTWLKYWANMCWVNMHSIARTTTTYRVIKVWQQEWTEASVAPRSKHNSVLVVLAHCRVLSKITVQGNACLISCWFDVLREVVRESLKCCSDDITFFNRDTWDFSIPPCNTLAMCGLRKHHCPAAPVARKGCFNHSSTSIMKYFCFPK